MTTYPIPPRTFHRPGLLVLHARRDLNRAESADSLLSREVWARKSLATGRPSCWAFIEDMAEDGVETSSSTTVTPVGRYRVSAARERL